MILADKSDRIVEGFCFATATEADLAKQELEKTEIIKKKMEGCDLNAAKSIYERAIMNRTFRTPVGHRFLYDLREKLIAHGVDAGEISPIPLLVHFAASPVTQHSVKAQPTKQVPKKKEKGAGLLAGSVILNIFLIIIVMAMFMITLYSDNPNILNYKRQIQDEYSVWEKELNEKEQELREREKAVRELEE